MFSLTRKTDYALVALAKLAEQNSNGQQPVSARQIAEQYRLPQPMMMQLLKSLHRAGIVNSTRGAGGGYFLASHPREISLATVLAAIEGPMKMTLCSEDDPCPACNVTSQCPITHSMQRINAAVAGMLDRISIQDLLDQNLDHLLPGSEMPASLQSTQSITSVTVSANRVENSNQPRTI